MAGTMYAAPIGSRVAHAVDAGGDRTVCGKLMPGWRFYVHDAEGVLRTGAGESLSVCANCRAWAAARAVRTSSG